VRIIEVTEAMHNVEQGGQAVHLPEGEYLLELLKVVPCSQKQWDDESKNPFMSARFKIIDGPVKNRPYSEILSWSEEGQFRMGRFLSGFGVGRPKTGTKFDHPKFVQYAAALSQALGGKQVGATLADNSYNGKVTTQAQEFYPAADYEDRKGALPLVQAVGAVPMGGEGGGPVPQAVDVLGAFENALGDMNLTPQETT